MEVDDEEEEKDDKDEEDDDEEEEEESEDEDEDEDEEGQDEPIEEEEGAEKDEDDDIIKVELKQEIKQEENPFENDAFPRVVSTEEKLAKANAKVYKWMAGIQPTEIEGTIGGWDNSSLLKMVEMADEELREHPEKFDVWRPWLKVAIKKCIQTEGFGAKYKDLITLMLPHL